MRKLALPTVLALTVVACGDFPLSYGDPNSIIAVMSPELWEDVGEDVYNALEPTIRTVRNEKTFTVTYQDPTADEQRPPTATRCGRRCIGSEGLLRKRLAHFGSSRCDRSSSITAPGARQPAKRAPSPIIRP